MWVCLNKNVIKKNVRFLIDDYRIWKDEKMDYNNLPYNFLHTISLVKFVGKYNLQTIFQTIERNKRLKPSY